MAITYTWKVTGMKTMNTDNLSKAVFQTYWSKTGTDEHGNIGVFSGATPFNVAEINPNNFVSFNNLTEETVLSWIKPIVTGSYEEHVNSKIAQQIADKAQNKEEAKLPWVPETEMPATTKAAVQPK